MALTVLQEISEAKLAIDVAERALDSLLTKVQAVPRAEKVTISRPIEEALQRLQAARDILVSLEEP